MYLAQQALPLPIVVVLLVLSFPGFTQNEEKKPALDSVLLNQKGIIGDLAKNLIADTTVEVNTELQRNDRAFQRYKDRIIRRIQIQTLEFGVSIADTSSKGTDKLKRLANKLHSDTHDYVIRNNLYFSEGEKLSPYLMGDNERHLRDLPFLQDARILVRRVNGSKDSVDVYILTKDVLSLGGTFRMHSSQSISLGLSEDNFHGWGDKIQGQAFLDLDRKQ
jgi:outer membrane protein assembly factor BamA